MYFENHYVIYVVPRSSLSSLTWQMFWIAQEGEWKNPADPADRVHVHERDTKQQGKSEKLLNKIIIYIYILYIYIIIYIHTQYILTFFQLHNYACSVRDRACPHRGRSSPHEWDADLTSQSHHNHNHHTDRENELKLKALKAHYLAAYGAMNVRPFFSSMSTGLSSTDSCLSSM